MNKPFVIDTGLLLHCLGHVRLADRAGGDFTPRTRKARALLAYLALTGRPAPRERLADLLWSDRGPEQARSSFRQALFELRHLGPGMTAVVINPPDEVAVDSALVTDLSAIRGAAEDDNFDRLATLLKASNGGLLTDLDGLDPEFDAWLQVERANQPSRTLAIALAAAERCLVGCGPGQAGAIVAEIQRLEPASEEAARLAFRIAGKTGDRAALHRQYELLRERLRADYDIEPSRETRDLFRAIAGDEGETVAAAPAMDAPREPSTPVTDAERTRRRWTIAVPILALLAIIAAAYWRSLAPTASGGQPPVVAVLPFDQQNPMPPALAEGLWDDTRLALSQNRTVRVLGRTTSMELDRQPQSPADLRRLGVDYLLEGGVRSQGSRVRIVVGLTRARDGLSVWEKSFEGRLGDPIALQLAVAQGIEGHLRGRLAPGGGVRAHQIATSPEVYALYSEARALIRQRAPRAMAAAAQKLREAVRLDPNYAPAWASLASTVRISRFAPQGMANDQSEAIANARRAIDLAPNLAHGYATLALVQGEHLPNSVRLLRRAVQLDPGNSEAWNWLGNSFSRRGARPEAVAAWERALAIDPFYLSPLANLIDSDLNRGQVAAAERRLDRLERAGADAALLGPARIDLLVSIGDYSQAALLLLPQVAASAGRETRQRGALGEILQRLGYFEEMGRLFGRPWLAAVIRGEELPPDSIDGKKVGPRDFWLVPYYGSFAGRAMVRQNRPDLLVRQYRQGFQSRDDFVRTLDAANTLPDSINLVVALRSVGDRGEADALLGAIDQRLRERMAAAPGHRGDQWEMARVRAQQGALGEAVALLRSARRLGWLPDGRDSPIDIADEPALRPLVGDRGFNLVRRDILAHVARERRQLGPVRI